MNTRSIRRKAGDVLSKFFPFGFIHNDDGTIVLFNHDYQVLTYVGCKAFRCDPTTLGICYSLVSKDGVLFTVDGQSYKGDMYYLYDESNTPCSLDREYLSDYLLSYARLMETIIGKIGNAITMGKTTDEQRHLLWQFLQS